MSIDSTAKELAAWGKTLEEHRRRLDALERQVEKFWRKVDSGCSAVGGRKGRKKRAKAVSKKAPTRSLKVPGRKLRGL
jgi:hypothetical protein